MRRKRAKHGLQIVDALRQGRVGKRFAKPRRVERHFYRLRGRCGKAEAARRVRHGRGVRRAHRLRGFESGLSEERHALRRFRFRLNFDVRIFSGFCMNLRGNHARIFQQIERKSACCAGLSDDRCKVTPGGLHVVRRLHSRNIRRQFLQHRREFKLGKQRAAGGVIDRLRSHIVERELNPRHTRMDRYQLL